MYFTLKSVAFLFLLSVCGFLMSSGKKFQARTVEGKKVVEQVSVSIHWIQSKMSEIYGTREDMRVLFVLTCSDD